MIQNEPLKVQQGDLSSPLYFDFIAAMQFWTVDRSLGDPKQRFREFCGEECGESQYRMVTRDGRYSDDAQLPQYFAEKFGQRLCDKLSELGTPLSIDGADGDPTSIATAVEQVRMEAAFCPHSLALLRPDSRLRSSLSCWPVLRESRIFSEKRGQWKRTGIHDNHQDDRRGHALGSAVPDLSEVSRFATV